MVFERYNDNSKTAKPIYCIQSTSVVMEGGWFSNMELDDYELELAVGTLRKPHFGKRIDTLHSALKKSPAVNEIPKATKLNTD